MPGYPSWPLSAAALQRSAREPRGAAEPTSHAVTSPRHPLDIAPPRPAAEGRLAPSGQRADGGRPAGDPRPTSKPSKPSKPPRAQRGRGTSGYGRPSDLSRASGRPLALLATARDRRRRRGWRGRRELVWRGRRRAFASGPPGDDDRRGGGEDDPRHGDPSDDPGPVGVRTGQEADRARGHDRREPSGCRHREAGPPRRPSTPSDEPHHQRYTGPKRRSAVDAADSARLASTGGAERTSAPPYRLDSDLSVSRGARGVSLLRRRRDARAL